jgi:hypothetical protein
MALFDRRNQDSQIAEDDEIHQAQARSTPVGSGGGKEWLSRLRGRGSQIAVNNAEEQNLPIDSAWVETRPTTIPHGGRGRDPGGWPKVIPVGVPPAVSGEPRRLQVPKELRIPALPTNLEQKIAVPVPIAAGSSAVPVDILDEEVAFTIGTLYISNMSTCWIQDGASGMYIPPNTVGWVIPQYRKSSKIHIAAQAPPGHAQPALTSGQCISVIATESVQVFSPGVACPVA